MRLWSGLLVQLLALATTVMVMMLMVMLMMVMGRGRRLKVASATAAAARIRRLVLNLFGYVFADLVDPDLLLVRRRAQEEQIAGRHVLVVQETRLEAVLLVGEVLVVDFGVTRLTLDGQRRIKNVPQRLIARVAPRRHSILEAHKLVAFNVKLSVFGFFATVVGAHADGVRVESARGMMVVRHAATTTTTSAVQTAHGAADGAVRQVVVVLQ